MAESNTEREEHGTANKEKSEIDILQPVLAHTHTDEAKNSTSRSNPSEIEPPKQSEGWRKGTTLITRFSDTRFEGSKTFK